MKELKVKNVIIAKQFEESNNYKEFVQIVKEKNITVKLVQAGEKLQIEKDIYFNILWPDLKNIITENAINNNAIVCKFVYKNFSILFTGDIEEEAEKKILELYNKNLSILKATIIKVAHHGSKSSSTLEFLNRVLSKIALIGVGENNLYGHPSNDVIQRLQDIGAKIYRTDENGEIVIKVNKKGKIKIKKFIE